MPNSCFWEYRIPSNTNVVSILILIIQVLSLCLWWQPCPKIVLLQLNRKSAGNGELSQESGEQFTFFSIQQKVKFCCSFLICLLAHRARNCLVNSKFAYTCYTPKRHITLWLTLLFRVDYEYSNYCAKK